MHFEFKELRCCREEDGDREMGTRTAEKFLKAYMHLNLIKQMLFKQCALAGTSVQAGIGLQV